MNSHENFMAHGSQQPVCYVPRMAVTSGVASQQIHNKKCGNMKYWNYYKTYRRQLNTNQFV